MALSCAQLPAALERGLAPCYLIGGPEPLLVEECRDQVRATAAAAGFDERDILQVDRGFDWDRLAQAAATPSLFASRRILDLRLPTGKPGREGAKALTDWASAPDPDTLLIVSCDAWDAGARKSKWAQSLERAGVRVDIWPVKPQELPGWIEQRMRQAGLAPDREAVLLLADRLEGNLLAARQEIEKLALLKGSGAVSQADVLAAVADSARFDAFLLVERVLAGDLADGLRIVAGLKRTDVAIQMVTGALVRELRILQDFIAALQKGEEEGSALRRLGVWRSRQGPLRAAARRLDAASLGQAFRRLSLIDRQSKGQAGGDPWQAMDHLVCALSRGPG